MACPSGCINGGGQPVSFDPEYKEKRAKGIFSCDKQLQLHKSQENPYVKEVYEKVLGEVGDTKLMNYSILLILDEKELKIKRLPSEIHRIQKLRYVFVWEPIVTIKELIEF
jgi:hypothetical protein